MEHELEEEEYQFYSRPISQTGTWCDVEKPPEVVKHSLAALNDPNVREQLAQQKLHSPWFLGIVTVIQVLMLAVELFLNWSATGEAIQTSPMNWMIGPHTGTLIKLGARFIPCMRETNFTSLFGQCISGIGSVGEICTLEQTCSLPPFSFNPSQPNQWYRFVFPIFLHGGVVHLLFNLSFQIKAGFQLERDIGSWRIGIIYMVSGIAGFIFGAPLSDQRTTIVGASGAIYGLIACLFLDLFQNWRLIKRPYVELAKMCVQIIIAFLIGTLPYIDNLAHIGGFTGGLLCGIILMPKIYFGKGDRYRKYALMVLSIPLLLVFCYLFADSFYTGENNCTWCKYFNCIPGMPWCEQKFAASSIVKQNQ